MPSRINALLKSVENPKSEQPTQQEVQSMRWKLEDQRLIDWYKSYHLQRQKLGKSMAGYDHFLNLINKGPDSVEACGIIDTIKIMRDIQLAK